MLGPAEPEPPLDVLPPALAEMVAIVQTALSLLGMVGDRRVDPLVGAGVGTEPYRGRARVAATPEEAIEALEPGDILVVRATSPAFNAVLAIAGAVVTGEGGPLSTPRSWPGSWAYRRWWVRRARSICPTGPRSRLTPASDPSGSSASDGASVGTPMRLASRNRAREGRIHWSSRRF